jgi:ferredoxin--NADP+ reductase
LTIADFDRKKGTVTIIFLEVGKTTKQLGTLNVGDSLENFVGPLGLPSEVKKYGTVVCVGGGVGIAPLYPIVKALREAGNYVISILGAKTKDLLILEKEISSFSNEFFIATDDGSKGHKGFVSDVLKQVIDKKGKIDMVMAIGPIIMMKVVSDLTKKYAIKTFVSLNPIMVDGTGMCGGCRVFVDGKTKFACVDGPEFDGHKVDYDNLMLRNRRFLHEGRRPQGREDQVWYGPARKGGLRDEARGHHRPVQGRIRAPRSARVQRPGTGPQGLRRGSSRGGRGAPGEAAGPRG